MLIDSPDSALMPSSQKKYKQYDYDKLDRFLRANLKKSTRYWSNSYKDIVYLEWESLIFKKY